MNRDLIPEIRISAIEPMLAQINPRLVFDLDDAVYLGRRDRKLQKILPHFGAVIAGNGQLAVYLRKHNANVHVIPTVADGRRYKPVSRREPGPLRIGWSGSSQPLREHLPLLQEAMEALARNHDFEFVVISNERPRFGWRGVRTRFVEWSAETEVPDLQQLDVGLMPLTDGPFERAKCAAKAILYMAVGIPAVVSPVGVSTEVVRHGETGFHCFGTTEWHDRLSSLIQSKDLRRRMGSAGQVRFEQAYSLDAVLPAWVGVLEQVASRRGGSSSTEPREHAIAASGGALSS
ncbi:MAG: glycosyltransferase family 4 protein [Acidobacteria bacterium]|nr:glycosyltransferase family 4 protein [Acidobacteriota bacterium]